VWISRLWFSAACPGKCWDYTVGRGYLISNSLFTDTLPFDTIITTVEKVLLNKKTELE
jgi:hypothetical protein